MNRLFLTLLFLILTSCSTKKTEKIRTPVGQIKTDMGEVLFWLYDEPPPSPGKLHQTGSIRVLGHTDF